MFRILLACVAFALLGPASHIASGETPSPYPGDALLDKDSSARLVLRHMYDFYGYHPKDARTLGDRSIQMLLGNEVEEFTAQHPLDQDPPSVLDPDTDPLEVLELAFTESGWSEKKAEQHALYMKSVVEQYYAQAEQDTGGDCGLDYIVYGVNIVICDDEGKERFTTVPFFKGCWEEQVQGSCFPEVCAADGENPCITLMTDCVSEEPVCTTLIEVNITPIPCEEKSQIKDCHCFDTGDDCDNAADSGCCVEFSDHGCPDCDGL